MYYVMSSIRCNHAWGTANNFPSDQDDMTDHAHYRLEGSCKCGGYAHVATTVGICGVCVCMCVCMCLCVLFLRCVKERKKCVYYGLCVCVRTRGAEVYLLDEKVVCWG